MPVYIAQTKDGWTSYYTSNNRPIGLVNSNPENYAKILAKRGHKTVTIRD